MSMVLWAKPALADLGYTKIDRATVRVFAFNGVAIEDVQSKKTKRRYKLAVPEAGHGSGIKVSADGLVLTAQHVIAGAREVVVKVPGSKKAYPARVVYQNRKRDFAFLLIPGKHKYYVPLPEAAPDLRVRQTVFAIGYPRYAHRKRPQSTRGVVSGMTDDGSLQLGVAVNPGNSGGPLIDEQENLLGIIFAKGLAEGGLEGMAFATGLEHILPKLAQVRKFEAAARRDLDKLAPADWAAADAIAALVQHHGDSAMLDAAFKARYKGQSKLEKQLDASAEELGAKPTLLVLACTYHWNTTIVFRDTKAEGWGEHFQRAKRYCKAADERDPAIAQHAAIVALMRKERQTEGYRLENARTASEGFVSRALDGHGPVELGGFRIGMSRADATLACERRGHELKDRSGDLVCDGVDGTTVRHGETVLKFCGKEVCRIDVVARKRPRDSSWSAEYTRLRKMLEGRYGHPVSKRRKLPRDCHKELLKCLREGQAVFGEGWSWKGDGHSIEIALGRYRKRLGLVLVLEAKKRK